MNELSEKHPGSTGFTTENGTHCRVRLFDRHGGVSRELYQSLNVGDNVGDEKEAVLENRLRVRTLSTAARLLSAKQVHGTGIYCLTEPLTEDREVDGVDGLITDLPDVGLMIQQADCQAVLFFDPVREVIAAVHCGWRGSVQGILARVITVMAKNYGTVPADLHGVISPSLGPCCAEFVNYREELPREFRQFMVRDNYFDFWRISRYQLMSAGMSEQRIRTSGICTCCSDEYFSYRRATRMSQGVTGRNCSVITLEKAVTTSNTPK
ncbi:MAG: peptidoglycan editing factor PgeF [Desulforhopalus sp.]